MLANFVRDRVRAVDMRVDIRLRVHVADGFQHLLAATHANEPVVDDCYSHANGALGETIGSAWPLNTLFIDVVPADQQACRFKVIMLNMYGRIREAMAERAIWKSRALTGN